MANRTRMAYCNIRSCTNFKGTYDADEQMFRFVLFHNEKKSLLWYSAIQLLKRYNSYCRIPKESNRRSKWIEVITKYQTFNDTYLNTFKVCHRHFSSNDFILRNKTRLLKVDAVPSIFADVEDACSIDNNNSDELKKNTPCESCEILQIEKTNLSKKNSMHGY